MNWKAGLPPPITNSRLPSLAWLNSTTQAFTKSPQSPRNLRAGGAGSDLGGAHSMRLLKTTEAKLPAVTLQRAQFEHALALLAGQPASTFRISEHALSTTPPLIPTGLPSALLERRPDVSAAERAWRLQTRASAWLRQRFSPQSS